MTDTLRAQVRRIALDEIRGADSNVKTHDVELVAASIRRFGFADPPVVDQRTGELLAGHGRVEALRQIRDDGEDPPAGINDAWEIPVYVGWASADDDEADAARVALNRTTEAGGWDEPGLLTLLERLSDLDDGLTGVGYDEAEVDSLRRRLDLLDADELDPQAAWDEAGMPDYQQDDLNSAASVVIHFPTDDAADRFFKELVKRPRVRSMWWPETDGHHGATIKREWVAPDGGPRKILEVAPTKAVDEFAELLAEVGVEDAEQLAQLAAEIPKWREGKVDSAPHLERYQSVEDRWYASLDAGGEPDWSIYDDTWYLPDLWGCWIVYSRTYLKALLNPKRVPPDGIHGLADKVETVADLGCGIGFSTAALAQMFPEARTYGTNLPGGVQWEICSRMSERYGFDLIESPEPADVVFASEYFEHFIDPVEHVREIIEACDRPRLLIAANAFCQTSVGHFYTHTIDGQPGADAKATNKAFRQALFEMGYEPLDLSLWNNRPEVYRRA